ncbi:MAG TPA: succinyl-diaminopimelate desuccinylase [Hyphomicrobiaceae bacterium]|jgi:succinyl-diaminopimelate desuccinylase|nr:succinyl-diaminopimelate desuccinylase [Hyphomicrobiaceae bacterium]
MANQDPVELAQALIRCRSVTPVEGGALTLLESVLQPAGFTCHRLTMTEPGTPDVQNLYARIGTGAPHLCFAGHTDVVPVGDEGRWSRPPFGAEIAEGVLYGRGAADMKGGVACFVAAALDYIQAGGLKRGSISFLITGDEEGAGINGTVKVLDWMKAKGEVVDGCLVGEPTSSKVVGDELKIGRRGYLNAEVIVHGKQGHSAYGQLADNPLPKLARIIDRVSSTPMDAGTARFQPSSVQATIVSVPNTATNVIPGAALVNFNIRYNDLHTRAGVEAWVRTQVESAAKEVGAQFSLRFFGIGDVFLTEPGPLVETMRGAVQAVTGRATALTTNGGTSDARFIFRHCPVIELGLVNATVHQVDERVPVADLLTLTQIYRRFIQDYFVTV